MSKYFKTTRSFTIDEIVKEISAECSIDIDKNKKILNVNTIQSATNDDITFLSNYKYLKYIENTNAYACIVKNDFNINNSSYNNKKLFLLKVENPYEAFAKLLQLFYPKVNFIPKIGNNVVIDETSKIGVNCFIGDGTIIGANVEIGNNVYIGYNVVILNDVKIGNNCIINSLCSIKYAEIGNDCIIHEGVKIGQDGFGFVPTLTGSIKIPQIGGVTIGNNVELGANTCVDRGAVEDTIIKSNTKIDNLVQIAHNVEIGENCFIAAQTGIAGSSKIGNFVFIGGQCGIGPHLNIENYSQIVPKSGIMKDVKEKSILASLPAMPLNDMLRLNVILKKLVKKDKI